MNAVRRRRLLMGAVLFGFAAGFSLSLWSWPQDKPGTAPVRGVDDAFLSEPAFSPSASAADLRQATQRAAEELINAFPQSPEAQAVLARAQESRVEEAVGTARQIAIQTHLDAGLWYRQNAQVEKAVEMLRKAAALGPQDVRPRTELLSIYVKEARDREALEVCRQLSRIEPNRGDYWLKLGLLRARLDDLEGARSALKRALEIDPGNVRYREVAELLKEE